MEISPDIYTPEELQNWTGENRWNAVYTVCLGELVENGVFDWSNEILDWKDAAYNEEQYERVCKYFIERFRFREISIEPFYEWATQLHSRLVFELMPKYRMMYAFIDDGFDIAQTGNHYEKARSIGSDYPETLLSGNADYVSTGKDDEKETIDRGNLLDSYNNFNETFESIDKLLLDELESFFISLYTVSIEGM